MCTPIQPIRFSVVQADWSRQRSPKPLDKVRFLGATPPVNDTPRDDSLLGGCSRIDQRPRVLGLSRNKAVGVSQVFSRNKGELSGQES